MFRPIYSLLMKKVGKFPKVLKKLLTKYRGNYYIVPTTTGHLGFEGFIIICGS